MREPVVIGRAKLKVMDEFETLDLMLAGKSISRYGDGELKLCLFRDCVSQVKDKRLQAELKRILKDTSNNDCIVAVPRIPPNCTHEFWLRFKKEQKYTPLFDKKKLYGSSFITRPDNAPHINNKTYWDKIPLLWKDKDITMVYGTERSLTEENIFGYKSVKTVLTVRRDAYSQIDALEKQVEDAGNKTVLLMAGAAATCLAFRLSLKGYHALDLGHIGTFMRKIQKHVK